MACHVCQGFLSHTINCLLDLKRQALFIANDKFCCDVTAILPLENIFTQRSCQSFFLDSDRVNFLHEEGQFLDHVANEIFCLVEMNGDGMPVSIQDAACCSQLCKCGKCLLFGAIMKVTRQAAAFLHHCQILGLLEKLHIGNGH